MQNSRSWRDYLALSGKGMMMGAADAVPGVSGGTVAFMTGIYEELIFSLHQCGPEAVKVLYKQGLRQAWQFINGNFLLALFGGVLLALLSFARVVLYLLDSYPELLWSFFFGLILASCWLLVKQIKGWSSNAASSFVSGAILAYLITTLAPTTIEATPVSIFLSGMIAICAMILPGISGSFILLLMGMYAPVMTAIKGFDLGFVAIFGVGCIIGLLSFSRVLNWMFQHYHTVTLALLGGFMLGSLNKVWPWKYTTAYVINRHGNEVPLVQENILPGSYEVMTGQAAFLGGSIAMLLLGIVLVVVLERSTRSANG